MAVATSGNFMPRALDASTSSTAIVFNTVESGRTPPLSSCILFEYDVSMLYMVIRGLIYVKRAERALAWKTRPLPITGCHDLKFFYGDRSLLLHGHAWPWRDPMRYRIISSG
ncbi:hypothetical protein [Rhizobium terrae]|uniref:hypothetical protein n=1 Tax=Rhizobium terrae TaxID=2171756 RepID=UPI001D032722|nr:hypothetical protein [Rhizobium terrae]